MYCHLTCQIDADCLQTLCASTCTTHDSILLPCGHIIYISLPAVSLHMGCVNDITTVWLIGQLDTDSLQALCLSTCAAHLTVIFPALPAIRLYMGAIRHIYRILSAHRRICICGCGTTKHRRCSILRDIRGGLTHSRTCIYTSIINFRCWHTTLYNHDLNTLQTLCISRSSCWRTILRPSKPAVTLRMHTIIHIIFIFVSARKLDFNCFQTFCLSIRRPRQPSIGLTVRRILDSKLLVATHSDLDPLQALRLSTCTAHRAICHLLLPSIGLHMRPISHCHCRCRLYFFRQSTHTDRHCFALPVISARWTFYIKGIFCIWFEIHKSRT